MGSVSSSFTATAGRDVSVENKPGRQALRDNSPAVLNSTEQYQKTGFGSHIGAAARTVSAFDLSRFKATLPLSFKPSELSKHVSENLPLRLTKQVSTQQSTFKKPLLTPTNSILSSHSHQLANSLGDSRLAGAVALGKRSVK